MWNLICRSDIAAMPCERFEERSEDGPAERAELGGWRREDLYFNGCLGGVADGGR